ncbi:hypothetical protein PybrP1_005395 [[Pythium] brassicae (nom. inval.)]|nr:hypothetical protein PybrP1_005395 [[Pythium] brassicae (nom. inval.)]
MPAALGRLAFSLAVLLSSVAAPAAVHAADSLETSSSTTVGVANSVDAARSFDHEFKLPNVTGAMPGNRRRVGGFGVKGAGGHLQLCPTGDCTQSVIDVSMHHLHEVTPAGVVTQNRIKNFTALSFNWTVPVTVLTDEGVNVTTSSFSATLALDGVATPVSYKAQTSYYQGNGTAKNGEQIIDVPAGGLKLALWIENWPFLNETNSLVLGLHIASRNRTGGQAPKGNRTRGTGRDRKIDRVELQASMFLDSPVLALVDGAMVTINSSVVVVDGAVIVEYAFPKFKKLYYDPVVSSSEDASTSSTTPSTADPNLRSSAPATLTARLLQVAVAYAAALLVALY